MHKRDFTISLTGEDTIYVLMEKENGSIKRLAIVYIALIGRKYCQIMRVDGSHGALHKDKLYEKNSLQKEIIHSNIDNKLIESIIDEIKENWKEMRRKFIEKMQGE